MGKAKKTALRSLPASWRMDMFSHASRPEYIQARPQLLPALAVLWLTGCRPAELQKGVHVLWRNNVLLIDVPGVKLEDAGGRERGQPSRRYAFQTGPDFEAAYPALTVLRLLAAQNVSNEIGRALVMHDGDYLYNSVVSLGKSVFPKMRTRVSPYCFRHQTASDLKRDPDVSLDTAAKFMGHLSDYSIGRYGHAVHGGKSGRPKAIVETSRPVKHSQKVDRLARFKAASVERRTLEEKL